MALLALLYGPQQVVGAGQSNMAYMNLTRQFARYCDVPVSTTNIAINGVSLGTWDRNGANNILLIHTLKEKRPNVLLWWQGEADAFMDNPQTYGKRFKAFISRTRADADLPNLIIIFVQLGKANNRRGWEIIKQQQANIRMQNVYMVRSDDLLQDSDQLHYLTTDGYEVVGQRLAYKFNQLIGRLQ